MPPRKPNWSACGNSISHEAGRRRKARFAKSPARLYQADVGAKTHRTVGPVAQWLEPAAHNGLVGGSSPSRPTRISQSNAEYIIRLGYLVRAPEGNSNG